MRPVGINDAVQRALPNDVIDVAADCPRSGDSSPHLHNVDGPVVGGAPLTTEEALASASHAADAGRRTNDGLNDVHQVAGAWDPAAQCGSGCHGGATVRNQKTGPAAYLLLGGEGNRRTQASPARARSL